MNNNDWLAATGSYYTGRGGRPINPKMFGGMVTKAAKAMPMTQARASSRRTRKLIAEVARISAHCDTVMMSPPSRTATKPVRDASLSEQYQPGPAGAAARMRHTIAAERARKRF